MYIFFSISSLVLVGAAGDYVGGRYAVIPGVSLLLIIFHCISLVSLNLVKNTLKVLVISSLIFGIYEFRPPIKNVKHQYIKLLDCINCPEWKSEVQKWKNDKKYIIKIWPYPHKTMSLN